jgi:hypothetical protein
VNKEPERTCVICRTKKSQKELFRFVVKDREIIFDKKQNELGRGFYVCSKKCWEDGVKKKKKIKISSRENKFIGLPEVAPKGIIW